MFYNFFVQFSIFLFLWITMFFWHELCHCFEAWRQNNSVDVFIEPRFSKLSMVMFYDGYVVSPKLVSYAGGVYCSSLCFIVALLMPTSFLVWSFLTLGWVQLSYGILEGLDYVKYRYWLYFYVLSIMLIWWCLCW